MGWDHGTDDAGWLGPVTWLQVLPELQRDWARGATAGAVSRVIVEHGGTFGVGMQFGQAVGWTGPKAPAG